MRYKLPFAGIFVASMIYFGACAGSGGSDGNIDEGKKLFERYCVLCHGVDGKLQINVAFAITKSEFTLSQRIDLMKNGRNLMTPFEGILSEDEMKSIALYAVTLKE